MSPVPLWCPPPEMVTLGSEEVHVWCAMLDLPVSQVQSLLHTLAVDEQARAERFSFQKAREHFIVARWVLRAILGLYLNREPSLLHFCYNPYGKPALAEECDGDTFRFNVSHSHGLALYAITRNREVGIDLERIRTNLAIKQIAQRFYSPQEAAMICALPADMQPEAFFSCWTRKEAYIKARGEGLSFPLDQFDVSSALGQPAALLSIKGYPQEASPWTIQELTPASGYAAALAVEGHGWRLAQWEWPTEVFLIK